MTSKAITPAGGADKLERFPDCPSQDDLLAEDELTLIGLMHGSRGLAESFRERPGHSVDLH